MTADKFLKNRNEFAAKVKNSNLYDFVDHFGLYAGVRTIGCKLVTYDLFKKTIGVPGDIAEFGCWKGSNLMFLAKIASPTSEPVGEKSKLYN